MPIRFRCAYCNQLMGISRRKVGTIVRCPKCSGQVVVPNAPDEPEPGTNPEQGAVKALEDPELEALLAGAAREAAGLTKPKRKGPPKAVAEIDVEIIPPPAQPPQSSPVETAATSPMPTSSAAGGATNTITISVKRWTLYAAAAGAIALLVLAFLLGSWLGR